MRFFALFNFLITQIYAQKRVMEIKKIRKMNILIKYNFMFVKVKIIRRLLSVSE